MICRHGRVLPVFVLVLLAPAGCLRWQSYFPQTMVAEQAMPPSGPAGNLTPAQAAQLCLTAGEALEKKGFPAEALQQYENARRHDPRTPGIARRLAVAYDLQGDTSRAESEYLRALQEQPGNAELLNDFGYFHYRHNHLPEAESWLRKAITTDPACACAWSNLGQVLASQGRAEESYQAFTRVLRPAEAYSNVGILLAKHGHTAEGRKALQEAIKLDPRLSQPRAFLNAMGDMPGPLPPALTHTPPPLLRMSASKAAPSAPPPPARLAEPSKKPMPTWRAESVSPPPAPKVPASPGLGTPPVMARSPDRATPPVVARSGDRATPPVVARSPDRATDRGPKVSQGGETFGPSRWHGPETMPQQGRHGPETMPQQTPMPTWRAESVSPPPAPKAPASPGLGTPSKPAPPPIPQAPQIEWPPPSLGSATPPSALPPAVSWRPPTPPPDLPDLPVIVNGPLQPAPISSRSAPLPTAELSARAKASPAPSLQTPSLPPPAPLSPPPLALPSADCTAGPNLLRTSASLVKLDAPHTNSTAPPKPLPPMPRSAPLAHKIFPPPPQTTGRPRAMLTDCQSEHEAEHESP